MSQLVLKGRKFFILFVVSLFVSLSCDDINNSPIPNVPVSFTVDLIIENQLNIPGNAVYFPGVGYGGIIIYCFEPGLYYAFDATCTYEANHTCVVLENEELKNCPCLLDNLILTCNCCGSQFSRIDGSIFAGPAAAPLKQYNVSVFNNSTSIRVYN